jgi:alpha,alpha-trehalase
LGNFPQALSHVGFISTRVALAGAAAGGAPELSTVAWQARQAA